MVKKGKNKNEWLVEGKNQPLYRVSKNDGWICECKAFEFRKSDDYECKHILEVKMFERQGGKNL